MITLGGSKVSSFVSGVNQGDGGGRQAQDLLVLVRVECLWMIKAMVVGFCSIGG